ncbi:DUF3306 domain-containing protein [Massilia sp. SYSU DXS3249]
MPEEGFLRRWARVKATGPTEADAQAEAAARAAATPTAAAAATSAASSVATSAAASAAAPAPASRLAPWARAGDVPAPVEEAASPAGVPSEPGGRPSPTLDDVARLTPDSDYSIFVGQGVDKSVQRLALKKLFADPHFNVMDRLDMYMDDYNIPSPVSEEMLASLDHARSALRRFVEDPPAEAAPAAGDTGAAVLAELPSENAPAQASALADVPAPNTAGQDALSHALPDAPPHNEAAHAAAAHEHSPAGESFAVASTHEHGPFHRPNQQLSQGQV